MAIAPQGAYYVYTLIDPRTDEVFYVGKGKGSRMFQHQREADKGKSGRKCDRIRAIVAAGHSVRCTKVSEHDIEADAYLAEAMLILSIGLDRLTNIMRGCRAGATVRLRKVVTRLVAQRAFRVLDNLRRASIDWTREIGYTAGGRFVPLTPAQRAMFIDIYEMARNGR